MMIKLMMMMMMAVGCTMPAVSPEKCEEPFPHRIALQTFQFLATLNMQYCAHLGKPFKDVDFVSVLDRMTVAAAASTCQ